jgi:hypothetical protein
MPSANIAFLNPGARRSTLFNIMWDAREPNLENQFIDATEFHGQTTIAPSTINQTAGANFQFGVFAGQINYFIAGDLTGSDGSGALGGPENLFTSRENVPQGGFFPPNSCFAPESLDGVNFCPGIFAIPDAFTMHLHCIPRSQTPPADSPGRYLNANRSPGEKTFLIPEGLLLTM